MNLVTTDAWIEPQHVVDKCRQLAQEFDADQAAADHDDGQTAPAHRRVGRRIGALELFDQVIPQHQRICHRLEREGVRRPWNQLLVGGRAECNDEMVVRQRMNTAIRGDGSNDPALHVDTCDGCLDEAGVPEGGPDRLRAVAQLQPAGAGFEQERRDDEEVLAADERDLDVPVPAEKSLQVSRGRHATESAAQYDDTHVPRAGAQLDRRVLRRHDSECRPERGRVSSASARLSNRRDHAADERPAAPRLKRRRLAPAW